MTLLVKVFTALLLIFIIFAAPSTADTKSIKILSDNRHLILFEEFRITHSGRISIGVSGVSDNTYLSQHDLGHLGFFLLSEESMIEVLLELQQNPSLCILDSKFNTLLFTFRDISPPPHPSFRKSYPLTYPSKYALFFANCDPQSPVTMDVHYELFNSDDGNTKTNI
ncbi:hypothetical protein SSX86_009187 [Deinandra increscens subsp. villosa]|uniref:CAND6/7 N-terminal domain-containing protein n=1 Tax=Deinandra increscens subsp. villosa TaxID=3103831 RepID=A0AAP0DHI4_9ASTR